MDIAPVPAVPRATIRDLLFVNSFIWEWELGFLDVIQSSRPASKYHQFRVYTKSLGYLLGACQIVGLSKADVAALEVGVRVESKSNLLYS